MPEETKVLSKESPHTGVKMTKLKLTLLTLFGAAMLYGFNEPSLGSMWVNRWIILIVGISLMVTWSRPWKSYRYPVTLSYFIIMMGLTSLVGTFTNMAPEPGIVVLLKNAATEGLLCVVGFLLFTYTRFDFKRMLTALGVVVTFGVLVSAIHSGFTHTHLLTPFISNPSMAGTFIALTLFSEGLLLWIPALLAILCIGAWTPVAVFAVANIVKNLKTRKQLAFGVFAFIGVFIVFFMLSHHTTYIHDNGRFAMWKTLDSWWATQPTLTHIFGVGANSIRVWLPFLQMGDMTAVGPLGLTVWAHNDWLQFLYEFGMVGIVLLTFCFFQVYEDATPTNRAFFCAFAMAMVTNFPTHLPLHALLLWVALKDGVLVKYVEVRFEDKAAA